MQQSCCHTILSECLYAGDKSANDAQENWQGPEGESQA